MSEFDRAIAYLVRRLDEGSSSENFLSAVHYLGREEVFKRERDRFLASIDLVSGDVPEPRRTVSSIGNPESAADRDRDENPRTHAQLDARKRHRRRAHDHDRARTR